MGLSRLAWTRLNSLRNGVDRFGAASDGCDCRAEQTSKAFDRVEHWSLFKKLIDRNVPLVVVRILVHWYRQQTLCVKWGRNTSSFFTVSNGVRQGGILSPFFFTLYIDELSYELNNSNLGCHINNVCVNHLFYADDLCLMAPSSVGLQHLIEICANYGFENDLLFNRSESMCMVVKPRGRNVSTPPNVAKWCCARVRRLPLNNGRPHQLVDAVPVRA